MKRVRKRCKLCGRALTEANRSMRGGTCLWCRVRQGRKEQEPRNSGITPVVVYGEDEEMAMPYDINDPAMNPMGC